MTVLDTAPPAGGPEAVIVHDFMEAYGGAERITAEIARAFPGAPVYAIMGRDEVAERMGIADRFRRLLRPRPALLRRYRSLAPVIPALVAATRLPSTGVVISSSYAFAHRFRARNGAPRLCYCHTPPRFIWWMRDEYRAELAPSRLGRLGYDAGAALLRRGDRRAARGAAAYLTHSQFTASEIRSAYGREAEVVGIPLDIRRFVPSEGQIGDYYLLVGRIFEASRRQEAAVEAFRGIGTRLVVAGDGPDLPRLCRLAPPNVEFTGVLGDEDLVGLMQRCRALVSPSFESFGLSAAETMACGRPVLALAAGGTRDTVIPGVTGEHFGSQDPVAIRRAVLDFDPTAYDPARIRAHAEQWDRDGFAARMRAAAEQLT